MRAAPASRCCPSGTLWPAPRAWWSRSSTFSSTISTRPWPRNVRLCPKLWIMWWCLSYRVGGRYQMKKCYPISRVIQYWWSAPPLYSSLFQFTSSSRFAGWWRALSGWVGLTAPTATEPSTSSLWSSSSTSGSTSSHPSYSCSASAASESVFVPARCGHFLTTLLRPGLVMWGEDSLAILSLFKLELKNI